MTVSKLVSKKLFVGAVGLLALNVPVAVFAANLTLNQTILPGGLEMVVMPETVNFPPLEVSGVDLVNLSIPTAKKMSTEEEAAQEKALGAEVPKDVSVAEIKKDKIVIRDFRYQGGFVLQATFTRLRNVEGNDEIPVENLGVLTFNPDGAPLEKTERMVEGTAEVRAPLNGNPEDTEAYIMLKPSEKNRSFSETMLLLDGRVQEDTQGRMGQWELYPAFKLLLPGDLAEGKYVGDVTYTLTGM